MAITEPTVAPLPIIWTSETLEDVHDLDCWLI
jgi:hypothetical protein